MTIYIILWINATLVVLGVGIARGQDAGGVLSYELGFFTDFFEKRARAIFLKREQWSLGKFSGHFFEKKISAKILVRASHAQEGFGERE
jgi:hypothetical protein